MSDLKSKSLAELHELAAKAGIEKFRLLRKDELAEKLGDADGAAGAEDATAGDASGDSGSSESDRGSRRRGGRDRGRGRGDREPRSDRERRGGGDRDRKNGRGDREGGDGREDSEGREEEAEAELSEITGVLDVLPRGSGIIRSDDGPSAGIYVSPAQIRRCELRSGDEVSGPVRPARRGERRPSLVRVEKVNG